MHSMFLSFRKITVNEEDEPGLMKNSGSDDSRLEQMRIAIDKIDKEILIKLNERASLQNKLVNLNKNWQTTKRSLFIVLKEKQIF